MMKPLKEKFRTYYIIHVNCEHGGCGCHEEARTNLPHSIFGGLRCSYCHKILGIFDWRILDKVKARGDVEALGIFYRKEK